MGGAYSILLASIVATVCIDSKGYHHKTRFYEHSVCLGETWSAWTDSRPTASDVLLTPTFPAFSLFKPGNSLVDVMKNCTQPNSSFFQRAECFLNLVSHFQSKSDGCRLTGHSALFFANECDIGFTPQEAISQGWMELLYVLEWYIYWWSSQPSNISSSAIKNPRLYMYVGSQQRQENTTKLDLYTYTRFYTRLIVRKFGYTNQAAACAPCSNHAMLASTML